MDLDTKQKLAQEFGIPIKVFDEMYVDELVAQTKPRAIGEGPDIEKTLVLKHNCNKVILERDFSDDEDDRDNWN